MQRPIVGFIRTARKRVRIWGTAGTEARKPLREEWAECREACADERDVIFDDGVDGHRGVIVGWICGVGYDDEGTQSEYGYHADAVGEGRVSSSFRWQKISSTVEWKRIRDGGVVFAIAIGI
ncbi:unnamed protein product [Periconia digitata]|uniref:Uncharacterized protein n=1 Tax=Periconia digitata TaxID=1303443 RepID=A0A9W4UHP8_9PLEO|nr:unnamed protein product [Periconia digitata]